MNYTTRGEPCPLCGAPTAPTVGPELFVAGTRQLVCQECARRLAPDLLARVELAANIEARGLEPW